MPYLELALNFPQWNVGEIAVRNALEGRGYSRCIARRKPPISEQNRRVRKSWAEAHRNMSVQDWSLVLWSDETWINDGPISPNFITRKVSLSSYFIIKIYLYLQKIKPGEEYDNECVSDKYRKSNSWMFWGCFSGSTKGPCVFWEKEWGNITAESYREHILPHVVEQMRTFVEQAGRCLYFMQDNAPSHKAASNIEYLQNNGIQPIFWPAFSPDLNPIEAVWSMMKSFIQLRYPEFERSGQRPIGEVRSIIQDAWDSITSEQLYCLILSMPRRLQAAIDSNGGPIGY